MVNYRNIKLRIRQAIAMSTTVHQSGRFKFVFTKRTPVRLGGA